ncbi:helix-turn-helix domain-containing protein [Angelakisella massiliensis]|uniref:helix-turn-helix domain-containing protein n=1 Tax=Angelakisella massiliensis TaxID=1871018 RepID=UPI0008F80BD6|nr:helix-turn-helix transcriptional regulator [Angelakisella massiliensis]
MSELTQIIGKRIRGFRQRQGLSQEALAERCGLHATYIGQVERGEKNASMESIQKIAAGLGISLDRLFEKIEPVSAQKGPDYPRQAYELLCGLELRQQQILLELLEKALELTI